MATCGLGRNSVEPCSGRGRVGITVSKGFACGDEFSSDETFAGCQDIAGKENVPTTTDP